VLLNLYWSLLIIIFGLCVGSFLNVVIYRWPRDLSIRRPLWSFCPSCRSTLHWRDNLPVVSYILLRGRCRYCQAPISLQYPLVELATAFSFLLIYDAFFVARLREGITDVAADWPILLAHWALAAGLVVLTVMDLEAYLVDIRVTWILTGLGLLLHTIWARPASILGDGWIRPGPYQAAVALAATVGLAVAAAIWLRRQPAEPEATEDTSHEPSSTPPDQTGPENALPPDAEPPSPPVSRIWAFSLLGVLIVAAYVAAIVWQDCQAWARLMEPARDAAGRLVWQEPPRVDPALIRTGAGLVVLFVAMVLFASHPHPEEDQGIVEAIDAEAVDARRNALRELSFLSPAILLIVATIFVLAGNPGLVQRVDGILHWQAIGRWQPLWGLATALVGWIIGGTLAWLTRILGTLGLGKEAFGMGDVHIMAAIGAIAGGTVAFIGFFAASLLALVGMVVILFRRQGRALPYGPWLALACFIVAIYQDKILAYLQVH
jgi:prepilin signal peptidase PulO-like enzyme (type II secretory pathway)